jgi:uncharacterized membrane protein YcaP (DUF421 family)
MDWGEMFRPDHAVDVFVRGSVIYLALFVLLRVVVRRRMGSLAPSDLLVIVLLADAAQNGMAGEYKSVSDGVVLCATIIFWATALDWLAFRSRWFRRVLEPDPLCIVREGRLQRDNMKREMLRDEDVESLLRQDGVSDLAEVRAAYLEPDGKVSVLRYDDRPILGARDRQPDA